MEDLARQISEAVFEVLRQIRRKNRLFHWWESARHSRVSLAWQFSKLPVSDLPALRRYLARSGLASDATDWDQLHPSQVRAVAFHHRIEDLPAGLLLALLSCHRNGFVREHAMRLLDTQSSRIQVPRSPRRSGVSSRTGEVYFPRDWRRN